MHWKTLLKCVMFNYDILRRNLEDRYRHDQIGHMG